MCEVENQQFSVQKKNTICRCDPPMSIFQSPKSPKCVRCHRVLESYCNIITIWAIWHLLGWCPLVGLSCCCSKFINLFIYLPVSILGLFLHQQTHVIMRDRWTDRHGFWCLTASRGSTGAYRLPLVLLAAPRLSTNTEKVAQQTRTTAESFSQTEGTRKVSETRVL